MNLIKIKGEKVVLRQVEKADLPTLWELRYGDPDPEWKKWDAPYFTHKFIEKDMYLNKAEYELSRQHYPLDQMIIEADGQIIGMVIFYWESEATRWLEMGIVIYRPEYWGGWLRN